MLTAVLTLDHGVAIMQTKGTGKRVFVEDLDLVEQTSLTPSLRVIRKCCPAIVRERCSTSALAHRSGGCRI